MSRLRVRIELNRGGVGVPLEKLASVVQQAQSFFRMLGDDVHIDQSQGDWLGFDFDHESLNFTAEFVGPVTQEQVSAFHAAFDGTTPLRRATISQFARIADAIEEDEVIGFGLYLNETDDPAEWRCLSRRDALRITEEIRVLLGAGEPAPESHLPSVADVNTTARYLFGRRDRNVDAGRVTGAIREVEASLSKRISRLEDEVADHSGHIHDLRLKSVEAEQSMGRLLSAVEGFCEQAAIRLETVTVPALAAAATASASPARVEAPKVEVPSMTQIPASVPSSASVPPPKDEVKPAEKPAKSFLAERPESTLAPPEWWRSPMVITVGLGTAVILLGMLLWPSGSTPGSANQVTSASEPVRSAPVNTPAAPPAASAIPATPVAAAPKPAVPGAMRVELEATEASWISIRGSDGTSQMSGLIEAGKPQSVEVREPAIMRVGNAGGLTIRANGKLLGPLGPHGAVRDVEFKKGDFKLVPVQ